MFLNIKSTLLGPWPLTPYHMNGYLRSAIGRILEDLTKFGRNFWELDTMQTSFFFMVLLLSWSLTPHPHNHVYMGFAIVWCETLGVMQQTRCLKGHLSRLRPWPLISYPQIYWSLWICHRKNLWGCDKTGSKPSGTALQLLRIPGVMCTVHVSCKI